MNSPHWFTERVFPEDASMATAYMNTKGPDSYVAPFPLPGANVERQNDRWTGSHKWVATRHSPLTTHHSPLTTRCRYATSGFLLVQSWMDAAIVHEAEHGAAGASLNMRVWDDIFLVPTPYLTWTNQRCALGALVRGWVPS